MVNMGVVNEDLRQILVRAGANNAYLGEDIDVSSATDPVPLVLTDEEEPEDEGMNDERDDDEDEDEDENSVEHEALLFADQTSDTFGKVTISGIQGTLQKTNTWLDPTHPEFAFVRDREGDPQKIEAGTRVDLENASKYIGDIPIFYFENLSNLTTDNIIPDLRKLVERYAGTNGSNGSTDELETSADASEQETAAASNYNLPFVLICRTTEGSDLDQALKNEFGTHYIRTGVYFSEMGDNASMSLAQSVYKSLDEQGCFTDIKDQIRKAVEEANNL